MNDSPITQAELFALLSYDREVGVFRWLQSRSKGRIGAVAGHKNTLGYIQVKIRQKRYLAHRLAWFYVHGQWPAEQIDHINRVRDDNRIANLRQVSNLENQHNQTKPQRNNRLGVRGVKVKGRGFSAVFRHGGRYNHLGTFDTIEEASNAYAEARAKVQRLCPREPHASAATTLGEKA